MEDKTDEYIKKCYTHIANHRSEDDYYNEIEEWEKIQKNIVDKDIVDKNKVDKNKVECYNCNTIWNDQKYTCFSLNICCMCDQYCQPYLSNPINKDHVIKYIPKIYWKYIFKDSF